MTAERRHPGHHGQALIAERRDSEPLAPSVKPA